MNSKSIGVMAFWVASLCGAAALAGCKEEAKTPPGVAAANKASESKPVTDPHAAEAAKAIGEKIAADKALAAKAAADKAAAEQSAAHAKDAAAALPPALVEARAEVAGAMAQLDLTTAKLETLSTAKGDLEKPSEAALGAIETLAKELDALKRRGDDMRNRGAAYFEAWEKQLAAMSTPEVLALATKRKDELSAKYAEVLTAMQGTRAAADAYWTDIQAIQKAIEDDLTPEGQKLLAPQVQAAKEKAKTLKERTADTSAKLDQVSLLYTKP